MARQFLYEITLAASYCVQPVILEGNHLHAGDVGRVFWDAPEEAGAMDACGHVSLIKSAPPKPHPIMTPPSIMKSDLGARWGVHGRL